MFKLCPGPQCPGGTIVPHHRPRSATARRDAEHSRPRPRPRPGAMPCRPLPRDLLSSPTAYRPPGTRTGRTGCSRDAARLVPVYARDTVIPAATRTETNNPRKRHADGHVRCAGTGSDSRIRFPDRSIRPAAAARTREPSPTRQGGISWFVDDDRPVAQQGTH